MFAVEMHTETIASLSISVQTFFHEQLLLLPWKSRIEISILSLSLQHCAERDKYGDCPHRRRAASDVTV
jgi:hypothetical protein